MRILRGSLRLVTGLLMVALLLAATGLFSTVYTYRRLTNEALVARLWFRPLDNGGTEVHLRTGNFCTEQVFRLNGEQWRLDARFVKWKPSINLLGVNARYRLERLSGRYARTEQANTQPHRVYDLNPDRNPLDFTGLLERLPAWLSPVDTIYGSSGYEQMHPDFEYYVYRSQSGLLVRRQPLSTLAEFHNGVLTITIEDDCEPAPASQGWFQDQLPENR